MAPTPTPVYNFLKPDPQDMYDVAIPNGNWDKAEAALQALGGGSNLTVITSTTRPGSPVANRFYWESDTRRLYLYVGSVWMQISGPALPVGLTTGATIPTDMSKGRKFRGLMTANGALQVPTNPVDGMDAVWEMTADTTARTLSLATGVDGFTFSADVTALTPIAPNTTDVIGASYSFPARRWRVMSYAKGF